MANVKENPSPKQVEIAYSVARRIARSFDRLQQIQQVMDFDDFVQEGVLAWLEGRPMYLAMLDAFRRVAKLSQYAYSVKGLSDPPHTEFIEEMYTDTADSVEDELVENIDAQRVLDRIMSIKDETTRFVVTGSLYFGISLRDMGEVLGKSHEWVRLLLDTQVQKLKEEFQC